MACTGSYYEQRKNTRAKSARQSTRVSEKVSVACPSLLATTVQLLRLAEFRANASLTDEKKIAKELQLAQAGVAEFLMYSDGIVKSGTNYRVGF